MTNRLVVFVLICLVLAAGTLGVFWHARDGEFIRGDDEPYVTKNPAVQAGLTAESISWAFGPEGHSANWHPLTWMSHMLDVEMFGMNPAGHHLTSIVLHTLTALLLFLVLARATGGIWASAFVAALFALHPLHVESVVWIAERKDVLSGLFWVLTTGAYVLYAERPGVLRYLSVVVCLALGLLAKPMLVTLPFVLLLMDYWPLAGRRPHAAWPRLVVEKLPLFAMAAASSVITFVVQRGSGAVSPLGDLPIVFRIGNAVAAYGSYMGKMLLPAHLSAYYPHPGTELPAGPVVAGAVAIAAVSALAFWQRRRRYLTVGWLWYLGTLVPVIGVVQVGDQAMADRYTYIPLIGLFMMVAWGAPDLLNRLAGTDLGGRARRVFLSVPAAGSLGVLAAMTWVQVGYWHDTVSLFEHALASTGESHFAHNNLAQGLKDKGRYEEAAEHYAAAIALNPGWPEGYANLGNVLTELGRTQEALDNFEKALELKQAHTGGLGDENTATIHYSMALALAKEKRTREAVEHLEEALRINPNLAVAEYALGRQFEELKDYPNAIAHYRKALRIEPKMVPAQNNLAVVLYFAGDYAGAWQAVADCRALGHQPPMGFLEALSEKMPEPR